MPALAFLKIKKRIMQQFSWHLILYCPYHFILHQSYCFYIIKISQNDLTWIRNLIFCTPLTFVLENSCKNHGYILDKLFSEVKYTYREMKRKMISQKSECSPPEHIFVSRPRLRSELVPVHRNLLGFSMHCSASKVTAILISKGIDFFGGEFKRSQYK